MQDEKTGTKKKFSYRKMMISSFVSIIAMGVAIFALAGRLDYWQGWLFFSIFLIFMAGFGVFFAKKQDLMQERIRPGPGVKWWDKIFFVLFGFPCLFPLVCLPPSTRAGFTGRPNYQLSCIR